jgi:hypothetical protein
MDLQHAQLDQRDQARLVLDEEAGRRAVGFLEGQDADRGGQGVHPVLLVEAGAGLASRAAHEREEAAADLGQDPRGRSPGRSARQVGPS